MGVISETLLARLAEAGFTDQRPAHNAVFANIPPEGIRLTDLADRAGMSKQAMSELVADLERLAYLRRNPDPRDGRAKLIEFTDRGWAAVEVALTAFDEIEADLARQVGAKRIMDLRETLTRLSDTRA
jgi:DNA-binding MarR family transcriptional regulator